MLGSSVAGVAHVVEVIRQKQKICTTKIYQSILSKDGNKSKCLNDIEDFKDKGWAERLAAYISCLLEQLQMRSIY